MANVRWARRRGWILVGVLTLAGLPSSADEAGGLSATSTSIASPSGVALDSAGNLFIVDGGHNRIKKVDGSGTIKTVAGKGNYHPGEYSGDGGPATEAGLSLAYSVYPTGLAVDPAGNLFFTDTKNHRIRRVDTAGIITTVAGNGIQASSGDGGSATNASLGYPTGLALDSLGNLFIADYGNGRIRKVDTSGTITTVASGVSAVGLALDSAGNLFFAAGSTVGKIDTLGTITTVAGDGSCCSAGEPDGIPATSARLWFAASVAVDSAGNLFIADLFNHIIRRVDPSGLIWNVVAGGIAPTGVTVDSAGNLFIADGSDVWETHNNRIRKFDTSGTMTTVAGDGSWVTLPTVSGSVSPAPNAKGWNNSVPVTVAFTCADRGSWGIASCTSPVTLSGETAGQLIEGTTVDYAGLTGATSTTVRIDTTPPTIYASVTPAPNAPGWNSSLPVTVTFECSDGLSGIESCPSPVTLTEETAGQVIEGTASDNAGNIATTSVTVRADISPPSVAVNDPSLGSGLPLLALEITGNASDNLSGVALVEVTFTNLVTMATERRIAILNGGVWTVSTLGLAPGPTSASAKATDIAGNNSPETASVSFLALL